MESEQLTALLIILIGVSGILTMVLYLRKYKNQELMAMIEKGVTPESFMTKQPNFSITLRFSLLLIGIGVGFLLGYFLDRTFDMDEVGYFSMLFIFGGLGLGAAYLVEDKKQRGL